jgi:transcription elongation factor Elf1
VSSLVLDRVEKRKKERKKTIRNNNKKLGHKFHVERCRELAVRWQFKDEPHEI